MIECYENKFLMICRYQYVSPPLQPKWHKCRLAVDMDIHGWIGHINPSMDIHIHGKPRSYGYP